METTPSQSSSEMSGSPYHDIGTPIMVNGCSGETVKAVIEAAGNASLCVIPNSFGSEEGVLKVYEREFLVHGPSNRETNAELYCKYKVPFVMGINGGNNVLLYRTVEGSELYAVISSEMGREVLAFRAVLEFMADKFPRVFSGLSLKVVESQEATKVDVAETTKAVISSFKELGLSFDANEGSHGATGKVRVPQEHLDCHAYHQYYLTAPDKTVSLEFKLNVCGRSSDAEGAIDAVVFLADKIVKNDDKKIYNMMAVLRDGYMP